MAYTTAVAGILETCRHDQAGQSRHRRDRCRPAFAGCIRVVAGTTGFRRDSRHAVLFRAIRRPGKDTFDDLHLAIQAAYDFDDDHLYSFSFDPQRLHPRKSCHSPSGEEAPFADELIIGQLNLYAGQKLLYIFDYGDWWEFDIEIVRITDDPHFGDFKILEQKGKSPEQYPAYDDDDW